MVRTVIVAERSFRLLVPATADKGDAPLHGFDCGVRLIRKMVKGRMRRGARRRWSEDRRVVAKNSSLASAALSQARRFSDEVYCGPRSGPEANVPVTCALRFVADD